MQLIKRLSSSFLVMAATIFIIYIVTGENIDWILVGINFTVIVLGTLIANSPLANKLKTKNK